MSWELQWGSRADALIKQAEDKNRPIPDYLFRPELLPGTQDVLNAFWELSTERGFAANGVGPIPYSKIVDYLNQGNYESQDGVTFRHCLRAMDKVFMDHVNSQDDDRKSKRVSDRPMDASLFDKMF